MWLDLAESQRVDGSSAASSNLIFLLLQEYFFAKLVALVAAKLRRPRLDPDLPDCRRLDPDLTQT